MNRKLLIIPILCIVGGAAIGAIAGGAGADQREPDGSGKEASAVGRFSSKGSVSETDGEDVVEITESKGFGDDFYGALTYDQVRERLHDLNEDMSLSEKDGYRISSLCWRWGELSPKSALAELKKMRKLWRTSEPVTSVMDGWVNKDPESAAAYYLEERENNFLLRKEGAWRIVEELAFMDSKKAWDFFSRLSKQERDNYGNNFIRTLLEINPREMGKYAAAYKDAYDRDYLTGEWRKADKEGYDQWVKSLPEKEQSRMFVNDLVNDLMDNPETVTKIFSSLSLEEKKDFLAQDLRAAFRKEGSVKMLDWLLENSPKGFEKEALKTHMGMVRKREYSYVESWVDKLPAGEIKDSAIIELSKKEPVPGYDMNRTMRLVQSLADKNSRMNRMDSVLRNWTRSDPESALQWLADSSGFSEDERAKWRREMERASKPLIK